jgi:hypothetical protein
MSEFHPIPGTPEGVGFSEVFPATSVPTLKPGESCFICSVTNNVMYMLNCHTGSEDLVCRDCFAHEWQMSVNKSMTCPVVTCQRMVHFSAFPMPSIEKLNVKELLEDMKEYRLSPEMTEHPVTFVGKEAAVVLDKLYELHADRLLDTELGAPHYEANDANNFRDFQLARFNNPFYALVRECFTNEHNGIFKYILKADSMEKTMLERLLLAQRQYVAFNRAEFVKDFEETEGDKALDVAVGLTPECEVISNNWKDIITQLVNVLCYCHLDRFGEIDHDEEKFQAYFE